MLTSGDVMEFQFAHKTYIFNEEAVKCYKWLSCMFGLSGVGEKKEKLEHNLFDYLQDVEMYKIRHLLEQLDFLQSYYNGENTVISNEDDGKRSKYLKQLESFLSNGPGSTKGLDVPYQCTKCYKTTWEIEPVQVVSQHSLEHLSNTSKVCVRCGYVFSSISNDAQQKLFCVGTTHSETCDHLWG